MGVRAFLALDLPEAVRDALTAAQRSLDSPGGKIKWVARENLHVTVKFLGDVAEDSLSRISAAAAAVAAETRSFPFTVRGVQVIPPRGAVRMIWAGVDEAGGRLAEFFRRLDPAVGAFGIQREKRTFRPHVTLARVKFLPSPDALRRAAADWAHEDFGAVDTPELVTYSSHLTPSGPIYTPLARAAFGSG